MPQHFDADLSAWLAAPAAAARRAPLRWLHQLRVQDYQQASGTLGQLPQVTCCQPATHAIRIDTQQLGMRRSMSAPHLAASCRSPSLPLRRAGHSSVHTRSGVRSDDPIPAAPQSDVATARRALALAKLSALAAGGEPAGGEAPQGSAATVAELDARLSLLALQVDVKSCIGIRLSAAALAIGCL